MTDPTEALAAQVEALRSETAAELELIRLERASLLADKAKMESDKVRAEARQGLEINRKASDVRSAEGEVEARGEAARLARQVSQDAIALAEQRGIEKATLTIWQRSVDKHFEDNNGSIDLMRIELTALGKKIEEIITGLAMKRATDATLAEEMKKRTAEVIGVNEFRKWAIGLILTVIGLYIAGGGHF